MSVGLRSLPFREQRGSRARCVLLADGTEQEVAGRLTALVAPHAVVAPGRHVWAPRGFQFPDEAKLGETAPFLSAEERRLVTNWWLAAGHDRANTPNWDLVSQATIGGREGLLLVEAKAHDEELRKEEVGKREASASPNSQKNHDRIGVCIGDASAALCAASGLGWNLSRETCYQMSNRFAWAWKVTTFGIPVILVYLGFLNAQEMKDRGVPFSCHEEWERLVRSHSAPLLPGDVWEQAWGDDRAPFIPLIRTMELPLPDTCP